MNREIILVELINQDDMSTEESRAFTDNEKAESYFLKLIKEWFGVLDEEDLEYALDNGYYDDPDDGGCGRSVSIKEIILEDDIYNFG